MDIKSCRRQLETGRGQGRKREGSDREESDCKTLLDRSSVVTGSVLFVTTVSVVESTGVYRGQSRVLHGQGGRGQYSSTLVKD